MMNSLSGGSDFQNIVNKSKQIYYKFVGRFPVKDEVNVIFHSNYEKDESIQSFRSELLSLVGGKINRDIQHASTAWLYRIALLYFSSQYYGVNNPSNEDEKTTLKLAIKNEFISHSFDKGINLGESTFISYRFEDGKEVFFLIGNIMPNTTLFATFFDGFSSRGGGFSSGGGGFPGSGFSSGGGGGSNIPRVVSLCAEGCGGRNDRECYFNSIEEFILYPGPFNPKVEFVKFSNSSNTPTPFVYAPPGLGGALIQLLSGGAMIDYFFDGLYTDNEKRKEEFESNFKKGPSCCVDPNSILMNKDTFNTSYGPKGVSRIKDAYISGNLVLKKEFSLPPPDEDQNLKNNFSIGQELLSTNPFQFYEHFYSIDFPKIVCNYRSKYSAPNSPPPKSLYEFMLEELFS